MANSIKKEPLLFTPGPLTTSIKTKRSMLVDYGSWDDDFNKITKEIRERLVKIIKGDESFTCIPLQGSGTFGVEAMIINFIKKNEKVLILVNGAYGERILNICKYHKLKYSALIWDENKSLNINDLKNKIKNDPEIKHLAFVHCETSTGILNPLNEVNKICKSNQINLYIDAMSSFGAINIDSKKIKFKALVASSNKCIEGVPGLSFCLTRVSDIKKCKGNSDNLSMDLFDQWKYMEKTQRWRYTPPTHVVLAFLSALKQFDNEGGTKGRNFRYNENLNSLLLNMKKIGFISLLPKSVQSPIIVTFLSPVNKKFIFMEFYSYLKKNGYIIYPGKMAKVDSFRIGCIGHIDKKNVKNLTKQINKFLKIKKISIN